MPPLHNDCLCLISHPRVHNFVSTKMSRKPCNAFLLAFAYTLEFERYRWLMGSSFATQIVPVQHELYLHVFEVADTECTLSACFQSGRDASACVPEVREVVVVAEDIDPYLRRQRWTERLAVGLWQSIYARHRDGRGLVLHDLNDAGEVWNACWLG